MYLRKRSIAILTHRMYIAILSERMRKKQEQETQEVAMRLEVERAFPTDQPVGPSGEMGTQDVEEQTEQDDTWLTRRFPGYEWDQRIGDGASKIELDRVAPTGKLAGLPPSFAEPLRWYWSNVRWARGVATRGRLRGTTWLQLALDFEAATGKEIVKKTKRGGLAAPTMAAKARAFALASWATLREGLGGGKHPKAKRVKNLANLMPIGAERAAGISPAVELMCNKETAISLIKQIADHPLQNKARTRWKWRVVKPKRMEGPLWAGPQPEIRREPSTQRTGGKRWRRDLLSARKRVQSESEGFEFVSFKRKKEIPRGRGRAG